MKDTCQPNPVIPSNDEEGFFPDHTFNTHFVEPEAFVAALVAAAVSGANISTNERIELFTYLKHSKLLKNISEPEISDKMAQMFGDIEERGFDYLFDQVLGFYVQSYNSSIYRDACKVIYLIKNEDLEGNQFLEELRTALGLSDICTWEIHAEIRGAGAFPLAA